MNAEAFVSQTEEIVTIVEDAIEQLSAIDDTVAATYLEKLLPFTR